MSTGIKIGVAILAYNRPSHLQQVVQAVIKHGVSSFTVYIDGPANRDVEIRQGQIIDYLNSLTDVDISVVRRKNNGGLAKSITGAVNSELEKNDAVIIIEDDCVPRAGYFEFMFRSIEKYKENKAIRSVCGYQFPFATVLGREVSVKAMRRFTPWGWGTWRDRWEDYDSDLKAIVEMLEHYGMRHRLPQDLKVYCANKDLLSGNQDIWSLPWVVIHYLTDTLAVYPTYPLVENIGFDGSGVHCVETADFEVPEELSSVRLSLPDSVEMDLDFDRQVERFLNGHSIKTMLRDVTSDLRISAGCDFIQPFTMQKFKGELLSLKDVPFYVEMAVEGSPIIDIHTHLFPPQASELYLSGFDDLLNYHYLVAEVLVTTGVDVGQFRSWSKSARAEFVWDELFRKRSPLSEATQGVLTLLSRFHISPNGRRYADISHDFANVRYSDNAVFQDSGVTRVVMTNDPFDPAEWALFADMSWDRSRYLSSMRLDRLVSDFEGALQIARAGGAAADEDDALVVNYLERCRVQASPVYVALSLENLDDGRLNGSFPWKAVLDWAADKDLPFALMLGVQRGVNPAFGMAGDGIGELSLQGLSRLCREHPRNRFLVTTLTETSQHELAVLARKYQNLTIFGFWWFMNQPTLVARTLNMRFDLLGMNFIPQHSDARITDQLVYKWAHFKDILKGVLIDRYGLLIGRGWPVTAREISRDVVHLLYGMPARAIGLNQQPLLTE